jgi:hypothetical protein
MKKLFIILAIICLAAFAGMAQKVKPSQMSPATVAAFKSKLGIAAIEGDTLTATDYFYTKTQSDAKYLASTFQAQTTLTDGPTITWNASISGSQNAKVALAGNRTLVISNPISGVTYSLLVVQDATGSRTIAFPLNTIWQSSSTLSKLAGSIDKISLTYDGTSFYAVLVKNFKANPSTGAVLVYEMDETSGTTAVAAVGTNGTLSGGTLVNQTGKVGKAYTFDGVDDDFATNITGGLLSSSAFSISFWIYPNGTTGTILSTEAFSVSVSTTNISMYSGALTPSTPFFTAITSSVWTHVVITYSGSQIILYKNGVVAETVSVTGTLASISNAKIGSHWTGSSRLSTTLDQFAYFNTVKTVSEVAQIYNGGNGLAFNSWATVTTTQSATPIINTDVQKVVNITGIAQAITSMTTNLTGTPADGDELQIAFTDNGTARAITWGAKFEASTVALPTTTVISTRLDCFFVWNSVTQKWRIVKVS